MTPWARIKICCWRHLGEERVLYSNVIFPKLWQYGTILYSSVGKSHSQKEDFRAIDLLGFRPFFLPTMPIVFLSRCLLFSHGAGKISTSIKSRHFFLYFSRQYIIYYILYTVEGACYPNTILADWTTRFNGKLSKKAHFSLTTVHLLRDWTDGAQNKMFLWKLPNQTKKLTQHFGNCHTK